MAAPAENGFAMSTSCHAGVLSAAAARPASAKLLAVSADTVASGIVVAANHHCGSGAPVLSLCSGLEAAECAESYSKAETLSGASNCLQGSPSVGKNNEG